MNINSIEDFKAVDWSNYIEGHVKIASNLGMLRPEQIFCDGHLVIGENTYVSALHSIGVGGYIVSESSVSATGFIEAKGSIHVLGLVEAGSQIRSGESIWARSQLSSGMFIEAGREITSGVDVQCSGNLSAGLSIRARGITAGGCIIAGGNITAKNRVIAGVGAWHNGEKSYSTITCSDLVCASHIGELNIVKTNATPKSCHGGQTGKFCSECGEKL